MVTAALATKWLESNTNNRHISDKLVEQFADEMRKGRWRVTAQGLTFDKAGTLIDGQHRLWAVVNSGCDVRMLVLRNAEADALGCVDTGRSRSVSDVMKLRDGTPNAAKVKAMIAIIDMLHNGYRRLSYFEVKELHERYKVGIDWACSCFASRIGIDAPYVSGALAFAYPSNKSGIQGFTERLRGGIGLTEGEPALALRNYLILRRPRINEDRRVTAMKVLRAALGSLRGEKMHRLEQSDAGYAYFAAHYRNEQPKLLRVAK